MNKSSFFIVGKHAVFEALKNEKRKILKVFLTEESKKNIHRLSPTKNLLRGNDPPASIKHIFKSYTKELINHYKFIDKKEIIQEEYKNLGNKKKKCVNVDFELEEQNKLMMKEKEDKVKSTIETYIDVKVKNKKEPPNVFLPQKKIINIKIDDYKSKGVKNKSK